MRRDRRGERGDTLNAATGAELWDRKVADHLAGYSMTAAPLVVKA